MKKHLRYISLAACNLVLLACSAPPSATVENLDYPEPESAGAKILMERCTSCHGAPLPAVHHADIWPSVLFRMQNRMVMKAYDPLTENELAILTAYVQKHAGKTFE